MTREQTPAPDFDAADARVLDAYRQASAGEVPDAQTRAAILAAATRAVGARPQPVGAARLRRWRFPLAAAASVLVGAFALLLATQVEQRQGETERQVAERTVQPPAAPAPAPAAAAPAAARMDPGVPDPPPAQPAARTAPPREAAQRRAEAAVRSDSASSNASSTTAAQGGLATPPPPQPAATTAEAAAPAPAAALPASPSTAPGAPAATLMARPAARAPSAATLSAPAADSVARHDAGAREERARAAVPTPLPLDAWIERIVALRKAGRDDEADAELKALRAAHPAAELPPAVQRPPR